MIEKEIEKIVIEKIKGEFTENEITDFKIFGCWQDADEIKSEEDASAIVLTVKAFPRTYETPTIPDAQIQVDVSLLVRSDVDFGGRTYVEVSEILSNIFQHWQRRFDVAENDFDIESKFDFTGFQMTSGDCGIDKENCVWTYSQSLTVYGVIL